MMLQTIISLKKNARQNLGVSTLLVQPNFRFPGSISEAGQVNSTNTQEPLTW